ncbi:MAG TPA: sigma-70 family RNA polymerase sigma factor [Verrucomicrobiae bacterium]|jgi:RNA polymerase sigma-70 factor (ECF subfamily)|nr:sigma-70 family RNA polymerase sigma factor [Verrucomicrobiae bacterium]
MSDETIPTRTTLLERLKDWRDNPSWQEFFDTYWKLIYGFAIRSGLKEVEAQDVVQETMLSVAKHIPNFKYDRNVGSFKHWLLNMTRWRITDQIRRRENYAVTVNDEQGTETQTGPANKVADPASLDLDALWEAEWEKNLLESAVNKVKRHIDPEKYQIFDLLVNKEWPAQKVADAFGMSVNHVYVAKHRVTELIKEEIEKLKNGF